MNQQSRLQFNRILTILLIICLSLPGTAFGTPIGNKGKKNFDQGKKYEVAQQWDLAAQEFSQAVAADPGNAEYRLHLLRSLTNASIMFMKRGDELIQQNDQSSAYNAYRQAVSYDPTNELAKLKMDRIIEQQKALASGADPIKVSSTGNVMPGNVIETAAKPQRPGDLLQNVAFRDTKFKTLVTSLSNQLGLNVIMDESVKDSSVSLNLQNTTLPKALDSLLLMTKHTFEQVDRRTIFVYQDNPTNRQRFERLMLKTFYLGNASPDDVTRLVTSMLTGTAKQAQALKQQNALVVRASAADMKVIQQLIGMLDKNRPEVVLDVEIYEVSHSAKLQIGNQLSTSAGQITAPAVTKKFNVTENGVTKEVTETTPATNTLISGLGQLGGFMLNPGAAAAAGLLGAKIGSFGFIGLPPSSLSLLQSKANSKLLNRTQIHALDGEPNETKVGKKVPVTLGGGYPGGFIGSPIPTTTTTTGAVQSGINNLGQLGGFGGGFPGGFGGGFYNNIQYQDVGLVIKVTPTITNDGYVQVKMDLTSSNVEPAASESERLTPTFTQRSLTTISRIADGRTAVVAGVQQQSDGTSRSSVPVLGMVPILGRLFTTPNQDASNSDIIITVTPHVIRSAAINKEDHLAQYIGSLGGGNTISIEDVVSRAQTEDDQERRIIAAERRNQGEQVAAAPPAESALVAVTTEPKINPQPKVEVTSDPIPGPVQNQSASLTQPPRPAGAPTTTFTPAPTPAMAGPSGHSTVQNAVAPARPQPTLTPVVNKVVVSESGSRSSGQNNRENDNQEPDINDVQQAIPQPPPDVKPARMSSMSRPEQIEKARREEAEREAKAREEITKDPAKARAEAERQKALEEEMIRQYMKEVPKPPKNITPATIQPSAKPKPKSDQPAENKSGNPASEQSKAPAQAAESGGEVVELNMMPTTIKGQVGKSFILVLSLDGQASMTGANISLKYDPAMLQVRAVRDGGLLGKRPDITHQIDGGNLLISMQQVSDREGPVKASGKLLIVEFTALANGNTAIDVNRGDTHLLMSGGRGAQINATAARVQISGEAISRLSNEQ
jgi:general secretion pathway protein D